MPDRPKAPRAAAVAPRRSAPRALGVTVVNGDLTFQEAPLLLGHYRSTRLTGTERVMNDLIGGAMKHSLDLGVYPLVPGSHQIFVNTRLNPESPRRMPRPRAGWCGPDDEALPLGRTGGNLRSRRQTVIATAATHTHDE